MTNPASGRRYDMGVLIARAQTVTEVHRDMALTALDASDHICIIEGSADHSRDLHNPFTTAEREEMWRGALGPALCERVSFLPQRDVGNRLRWATQVEAKVDAEIERLGNEGAMVAVFGHRKDASSFYLDDFKYWDLEETPHVAGVSATRARDAYFRLTVEASEESIRSAMRAEKVAEGAIDFLVSFHGSDEWKRLHDAARYTDAQAAPYAVRTTPGGPGVPHPVQFNAVDPVVIQGNRILMHRRGEHPGKGYWALPGGMLGCDERVAEGAVRHAIAKTGLDVTASMLMSCLLDTWHMDDPWRSTRRRTISFPSLFELAPLARGKNQAERRRAVGLPRVRASRDVQWMTFEEIDSLRELVFEDHVIIVEQALERLARIRPR